MYAAVFPFLSFPFCSLNFVLYFFSRELKRLSTITLSPVYAHFQETLTGSATIRAMRASGRFMKENEERLDMSQRANYGG